MRRFGVLLLACLCLSGCESGLAGPGALTRPKPSRQVGVTIYSVPPEGSDEKGIRSQWDYSNYYYERSPSNNDYRRVAKQVQIYNDHYAADPEVVPYGIGIVQDERDVVLAGGASEFRFSDVAVHIEPDTVRFSCPDNGADIRVIEQSFEYDLATADAVIEKYVDAEVGLELTKGGRVSGRLLSADEGHFVLDAPEGVQIVPEEMARKVCLPELPEGLLTKPTLAWLVGTRKAGPQRVRVAYRTRGLMWESDYTAVLSDDEQTIDLEGVVTIGNVSGAAYEDARLKLVAGEVNLIEPMEPLEDPAAIGGMGGMCCICLCEAEEDTGFEEKRFFEYHMYTLGRPCTIKRNEVKQIELFEPARRVPVHKKYVYQGAVPPPPEHWFEWDLDTRDLELHTNNKVDVYLIIKNEKEKGLGIPLPAGPIRLLKRDPSDGQLEFIGDDVIPHTPKDEEIVLRPGSAFDIVGERIQTDFKCDYDDHWVEETFEIRLRNHKDEEVEVEAREFLCRWVNWEILSSSCEYTSLDPKKEQPEPEAPWMEKVRKATGNKRIDFEFVDASLTEALAFISKVGGVRIALEPGLMDEVGGEPRVTLHVGNMDVPLAILFVLRLTIPSDVGCVFKDGGVFITHDRNRLVVRRYRISGLGSSPCRVVDHIMERIAPHTWHEERGTIDDEDDGTLLITQTPEVHARVAHYISGLATTVDASTIIFKVKAPPASEKKVAYTVRYTW